MTNFSDPREEVVFYVPLWKRNGISLQQFDDYWRDVHGPVCARLPIRDRRGRIAPQGTLGREVSRG